MKKSILEALINSLISEALQSYSGKTPHIKKYRRSKLHPAEVERRAAKRKYSSTNNDMPFLARSAPRTQTPEANYEIPEPVKDLLNGSMRTLAQDPTAVKVLQGVPIGKKEAMLLAKSLMILPHFPIQQPRKLMNLLVLLAIENQKH